MNRPPRVVIIDGEIGAGKTTLVGHLRDTLTARGLKVAVVPEPVEEWKEVGILQEFYADKPDEARGLIAYAFQTFTFVTRIKKTKEVVAACPDADVYILERSVLTDRFVFMELQRDLVGPMRMKMYDIWWNSWSELMPLRLAPGKCNVVYLKPALDSCQARVETRAREGETGSAADEKSDGSARGGVSASYQARLRQAHEAYLEGKHEDVFPDLPARPFDLSHDVLVIEGNLADGDFSGPGPGAEKIVDHIIDRLKFDSP